GVNRPRKDLGLTLRLLPALALGLRAAEVPRHGLEDVGRVVAEAGDVHHLARGDVGTGERLPLREDRLQVGRDKVRQSHCSLLLWGPGPSPRPALAATARRLPR